MILRKANDGKLLFWCAGCGVSHGVNVEADGRPKWSWNGSMDKPTFQPSIRVRFTWGEDNIENVCHSFVTDGQIQYLDDCTHYLVGKTVPLPDFDQILKKH